MDVHDYITIGALDARRMAPRSGMVSNDEGLEGCGILTRFSHAGPQLHYHVPRLTSVSFWVLACEN